MKRLRLARMAFGYTVERLAEELGVLKQTVTEWESGKTTPTLAALRDLAVLYGTNVDDLAGDDALTERPIRSVYLVDDEHVDDFWGHVGCLMPRSNAYRWFPITRAAAEEISSTTRMHALPEGQQPSLFVETLNNRLLWINLSALNGICLCHDAVEWPEPSGDPVPGPGLSQVDLEGRPDHLLPGEYYRVMMEISEGDEAPSSVSEGLIEAVETFLADRASDLGDEGVRRALLQARVWIADGSCQWVDASPESMGDLITELQLDAGDGILRLSGPDHGYLSYAIPLERVAAVEVPAARLSNLGR